ncbi:unnamed protein product [Gongylonema pulchrum]|uniref:BTB domain-containing protein n=1 Tax=Gongylonema pulchrum TaxID=637853 RepID=A0A183E3B6_9BILA|nr:unnamed protein product [Gongylonema pulchrum]
MSRNPIGLIVLHLSSHQQFQYELIKTVFSNTISDIREIDCETAEGKIHVATYLSVVMAPTFLFMKCIGINHVTTEKPLKTVLVLYSLCVTAVQASLPVATARTDEYQFRK